MADKVTLSNVTTFVNDSIAVTTINNNNAAITAAIDNTLSLNGQVPNQMQANLDMNSNHILNLPAPSSPNEPPRLIDVVSNPTIVVPGTGTSGHVVPFLDGNNTWSGTNTFGTTTTGSLTTGSLNTGNVTTTGSINASGGVTAASVTTTGNVTAAAVALDGATSGTVTLDTVNAVASGTVLVPNGPATLLSTAGNASNITGGNIAYTNTVDQMTGYGFRFTPTYSTRVFISTSCQLSNDNASAGNVIRLRYGTGSSPAAGSAATGTGLTLTQTSGNANSAGIIFPCSAIGIATGLTPGVSIWIDFSASVNTGTGHLFNPFICIFEI